jgi:uncharacterized phiE125 gp8 family phage protein
MSAWDRLKLVTPPAADPITVAAFKEHARIDHADEDDRIEAYIKAATALVDGPHGIGVAMVTQTWRLTLDGFPCQNFAMPLGPVRSISSITYVDTAGTTQTLAAEAYTLLTDADPEILSPVYGTTWPACRAVPGAFKITFSAGFGDPADVPADLRQAVYMMAAHWYHDREGRAEEAPGVCALLDRHRRGQVAA